jgi:hypothetical protein
MAEDKRFDIQVWQNKKSKQKFRVMPWWEIFKTDEVLSSLSTDIGVKSAWKFGMLTQVGWLLENEHGVWFGLGPSAIESFEVLGPASKENALGPDDWANSLKKEKEKDKKKKKG